jgi:hypothetical protein
MPYVPASDPFATYARSQLTPGSRASVVTASAAEFATYPKALRIYVPAGTASPSITVLPAENVDGVTVLVPLSEGETVLDWCQVRAVTAIAAGVSVIRIDD